MGAYNGIEILIGDADNNADSTVIIKPTEDYLIYDLQYATEGSVLTLTSQDFGSAANFKILKNIGGKLNGANNDLTGILNLNATGQELTLGSSNGNWSIGQSSSNRMKNVSFLGDSKISVDTPISSSELSFNNSAPIYFNKASNLGTGATITALKDTELHITETLAATSPELTLDNKNLKIHDGILNLSGSGKLNINYSGSDGGYGKISTADGGSVNINMTDLTINFDVDLTNENLIDANNLEYDLQFFDGGVSIDSGTTVTLSPQNNNLFVDWNFDKSTGKIKSTTNWKGLQALVNGDDDEVQEEVQQIVYAITNSALNVVDDVKNSKKISALERAAGIKATFIIQTIGEGATEKDVIETLNALNVQKKEISNDSGEHEASDEVTRRALSLATSFRPVDFSSRPQSNNVATTPMSPNIDTINERGLGTGNTQNSNQPQKQVDADANILGYGIAAGDDLASKYGIWFAPFYHKATQKKIGLDSGYKVKNMGATISVDCKADEKRTIGFAWSHIKSIMNHKDAKTGSKAITNSNFFSLYGNYDLKNNLFLNAIGSYGISDIKSLERRKKGANKFENAIAKFKTQIYSGQVLLGKNIYTKRNNILTPIIGLKYVEYHDDAYTETGTLFQNYSVTKKKSSQLDAILGLKLSYETVYNGYNVKPHIIGNAFVNLKDNPSSAYVTSDAFLTPVLLKGDKRSQKAWYTIGAGADITKNNMEYAVEYEAQIDKKYLGHQAKIKVKVNL